MRETFTKMVLETHLKTETNLEIHRHKNTTESR